MVRFFSISRDRISSDDDSQPTYQIAVSYSSIATVDGDADADSSDGDADSGK